MSIPNARADYPTQRVIENTSVPLPAIAKPATRDVDARTRMPSQVDADRISLR